MNDNQAWATGKPARRPPLNKRQDHWAEASRCARGMFGFSWRNVFATLPFSISRSIASSEAVTWLRSALMTLRSTAMCLTEPRFDRR